MRNGLNNMKKIIICGGTGLIGAALSKKFVRAGHDVTILSRHSEVKMESTIKVIKWDTNNIDGWMHIVEGADAIINLAGQNIGESRWTNNQKMKIVESRINSGRAIVAACDKAHKKPDLVIQASAIGYYGTMDTGLLDESSLQGNDFLANLCKDWELSTFPVEAMGIRRAVIRNGLVLSNTGGVMDRLLLPIRMFAGGRLGSGKQWYSWIHMEDVVGSIEHILANHQLSGIINLTAPEAVQMDEFGRTLARFLNRPYWLPVPEIALKLLLGEMSMLVLGGQRVAPKRLLDTGYHFSYPGVKSALENLLIP